jgi:hypothetical protein
MNTSLLDQVLFKGIFLNVLSKTCIGIFHLYVFKKISSSDYVYYILILSTVNICTSVFYQVINRTLISYHIAHTVKLSCSLKLSIISGLCLAALIGAYLQSQDDVFFAFVLCGVYLGFFIELQKSRMQARLKHVKLYLIDLLSTAMFIFGYLLASTIYEDSKNLLPILHIAFYIMLMSLTWLDKLSEDNAALTGKIITIKNVFGSKIQFYLLTYSICISLMGGLDVIILNMITTPENTANYSIAIRFYSFAVLVVSTTNSIYLSQFLNSDTSSVLLLKRKELWINLSKIFILLLLAALVSPHVIRWLIDISDAAVGYLKILMICLAFSFIFSQFPTVMLAKKSYKKLSINAVIAFTWFLLISFSGLASDPVMNVVAALTSSIFMFNFLCFVQYNSDLRLVKQ